MADWPIWTHQKKLDREPYTKFVSFALRLLELYALEHWLEFNKHPSGVDAAWQQQNYMHVNVPN